MASSLVFEMSNVHVDMSLSEHLAVTGSEFDSLTRPARRNVISKESSPFISHPGIGGAELTVRKSMFLDAKLRQWSRDCV
jgi:hypothetical protein